MADGDIVASSSSFLQPQVLSKNTVEHSTRSSKRQQALADLSKRYPQPLHVQSYKKGGYHQDRAYSIDSQCFSRREDEQCQRIEESRHSYALKRKRSMNDVEEL